MIDTYIKEFIAVVEWLQNQETSVLKKDYIFADKAAVMAALKRNAYETAEKKLVYWRGLRWIETDPGRLTKRIRVQGSYTPAVKISLTAFQTLKNLV